MKKLLYILFFGFVASGAAPWVAVAPLQTAGVAPSEKHALTQAAVSELLRLGWVRVVERERMDAVLAEQALQLSGVCGDQCQVRAAQLGGAQYLVLYEVSRVGQQYDLRLRLLNAQNGEVLASEAVLVKRTHQELMGAMSGVVLRLAHQNKEWLLRGDSQELEARRATMVAVPAGSFMMGSTESGSNRDEKPVHAMQVAAFYLDSTEVTQSAYQKITHRNPSRFAGCANCPVENVTWTEANSYCQNLGKRLPTEAEWEYAARAQSTEKYFWGSSAQALEAYVGPLTSRSTYEARSTLPNAWGLYEMAGNVSEWVQDWYHRDAYQWNLAKGPAQGSKRVLRGGHWYGNASLYRMSRRAFAAPDKRQAQVGFRCAMDELAQSTSGGL